MVKYLYKNTALVFLVGTLFGCTQSSTETAQDVPASSSSEVLNKTKTKRIVKGTVLDAHGKAANDVEVSAYWSANGQQWNDDGVTPKLDTAEAISEFWNDEGRMFPSPRYRAELLDNGQFEILATNDRPYVLLALNQQRTHGGLVYLPPQSEERLTIRLEPLVRVYGEIRCEGAVPDWTCAAIYLGDMKEVPKCGACLRFTVCGSEKGNFSFLLPPGVYEIQAYDGLNARVPESAKHPECLLGDIRLEILGTENQLNLGTIELVKTEDEDSR